MFNAPNNVRSQVVKTMTCTVKVKVPDAFALDDLRERSLICVRQMLSYKSAKTGTEYVEVGSRFSTQCCSICGNLSGPRGFSGLTIRQWSCSECGTAHNRDVNAARNTLSAGAGCALEVAYG